MNRVLPEDLRDHGRQLNSKEVAKLMQTVAEKYPDRYAQVMHQLHQVGHEAATATGGMSFGTQHLRKSPYAARLEHVLRAEMKAIYADPKLTDDQKDAKVVERMLSAHKPLEDAIMQELKDSDSPLGHQIFSGAKGKPMNAKSLLGMDLSYVDHRDRPIPIPILRSYSQGLTPVEYFAGTFGTRKGLIDLKMATPDAGFLSKQLNQVTHRLVVTGHDHPDHDGTPRGLPVDTFDPDNEGALLAHPVAGYKRNQILTPKILSHIHSQGHEQILVRSPVSFGSPDGGLYANDVGIRDKGRVAPIGDYVGVTAAQALSEPLAQAAISSKHSGGVAGGTAGGVHGFKLVNQLTQVPKTFKGGGAHSKVDGRVQSVQPAPQGGTYVTVDGERHYVAQGFKVGVKPGDNVEAGDLLSDGIVNPGEVTHHKGIGEGRRQFVNAYMMAYKDAGIPVHRRNVELIARGLINHVRITEPYEDYLPDDVVPYSRLEHHYRPREGYDVTDPARANGMYLEKPVLHYTVGTKIRPSVVKTLGQFGVNQVTVHKDPPPFQSEMVRGMENLAHDPDWMTRFLGSYLQKNLLKGTARGAVSDERGTSYVPTLARGVDFGRAGKTVGWKQPDGPGNTQLPTVAMGPRDMQTQGVERDWRPMKLASVGLDGTAVPGSPAPDPRVPKPEVSPQRSPTSPQIKPLEAPTAGQGAPGQPPQQPQAQPVAPAQPQKLQIQAKVPQEQQPAAPDPMSLLENMRGMTPQQFGQYASGPMRPLMEQLAPTLGAPGLMMLMQYFTGQKGSKPWDGVLDGQGEQGMESYQQKRRMEDWYAGRAQQQPQPVA